MAGDQSFDVVSDFDEQELRNALDQVRREVGTRFDFKGVTVDLTPGEGRAHPDHRRRVSGRGRQGPDRVEGDPAQPVAQDLRLGQGRGGRRQQGPPADRPAARPVGGGRQEDHQADPGRVPEGQVADPGRRRPRLRQEPGRPPAGHRPTARARRAGPAPVRELPLTVPRAGPHRPKERRRHDRARRSTPSRRPLPSRGARRRRADSSPERRTAVEPASEPRRPNRVEPSRPAGRSRSPSSPTADAEPEPPSSHSNPSWRPNPSSSRSSRSGRGPSAGSSPTRCARPASATRSPCRASRSSGCSTPSRVPGSASSRPATREPPRSWPRPTAS